MKEKIKNFLLQKFHLKIVPDSAEKNIKTFSLTALYPVLGILILILILTSLFIGLGTYKIKYDSTQNQIKEAESTAAKNKFLKKELVKLKSDTDKLRNSLVMLNEYQHNVYQLLKNEDFDIKEEDFKLKDLELKNLDKPDLPQGGVFKSYEIKNQADLINNIKMNLSLLKKEIPVHNKRLAKFEHKIEEQKIKNRARPSIWPLADNGDGYISSHFGPRSDPKSHQNAFHEGLDVAVWYNTPVLAAAYGKVTHVGWKGGYGRAVIIDHGQGYKTLYGHLNGYKVKKGDYVKRGDTIALTGNSGRSTGPHLHYEVLVNSKPKNPLDYIGGR